MLPRKSLQSLTTKGPLIYWIVFGLGLLLLAFVQYFGLIYYHYPVPPGHDAMIHWKMAQPFYNGHVDLLQYLKSGAYPPGFLIIISSAAHFFHADMMDIMLWTTPAILIFASLAVFLITKEIFGNMAGLAAFYLYAFAAKTPIQQLNDGGYPNLIAAHIILPISLLFLLISTRHKFKTFYLALFVLTLSSIPFVHHVTTFYVLGILGLVVLIAYINLLISKDTTKKKLAVSFISLLVLSAIAYVFIKSPIFSSALGLLKNSIGRVDPEAIIPLRRYPSYIGLALFFFGFLGLIYLPFTCFKDRRKFSFLAIIILFSLALFIGSRLKSLSNPDRLVRDMALSLSILGGGFISSVFRKFKNNKGILILVSIFPLFIFMYGSKGRVLNAVRYDPMVRVTSADMQVIDFLSVRRPGKILVEGYNFYLPRLLPKWEITNVYAEETKQPDWAKPLDPSNKEELAVLKLYDFIYIVDDQKGWTPSAIKFHFAGRYLDNPNFELLGRYQSQTNTVLLFKVVK